MPSKWHSVQGLTSHTTSQIRIFESDFLSIGQMKGILAEFSSEILNTDVFLRMQIFDRLQPVHSRNLNIMHVALEQKI